MGKRKILIPFVAVLDAEAPTARMVAKGLRQHLRNAKVTAFWKSIEAWKEISREPQIEPYLVVTDWIGTEPIRNSFVVKLRIKYPRTQVVLYTGRATPDDIVRLQNDEGLIDRYVNKENGIGALLPVAKACFRRYEEDPVLGSVRFFLSRCKEPEAPFTVIDNREYSMLEMYWEMVRGTKIGNVTQQAWQSLLTYAVLGSKGVKR